MMSKEALRVFIEEAIPNYKYCDNTTSGAGEDVELCK